MISYIVFLFSGIVHAIPTQWTSSIGGNDNWYEFIDNSASLTWSQAKAAAESMTHRGAQGHLVTITSAQENAFVLGIQGVTGATWMGASDTATEGMWQWVTGETWSFTNWGWGEPNGGTRENYLGLWVYGGVNVLWNDFTHVGGPNPRFIVEWESSQVPEPTTILLFGTALIGLAGAKRKFKN